MSGAGVGGVYPPPFFLPQNQAARAQAAAHAHAHAHAHAQHRLALSAAVIPPPSSCNGHPHRPLGGSAGEGGSGSSGVGPGDSGSSMTNSRRTASMLLGRRGKGGNEGGSPIASSTGTEGQMRQLQQLKQKQQSRPNLAMSRQMEQRQQGPGRREQQQGPPRKRPCLPQAGGNGRQGDGGAFTKVDPDFIESTSHPPYPPSTALMRNFVLSEQELSEKM